MQHHERLDGSGYPQGLAGDAIVLDARIVAVADVFEAMTSHRPYRAALPKSHAITELLLSQHGHGALRAPHPATQISEGNAIHAADGVLDAGVRLFYCKRDGVDPETLPFMRSERERIERTLPWLDRHVRGPWCTPDDGFGLAELALVTTLEWLRFRGVADLAPHHNLLAFLGAHAGRPSLLATRPPGT